MQFQTTTVEERVETLDVLRGFSLLGILLVNILGFYLPQPYIQMSSWFTEASDIIWHQRLDMYVQGSFYPLFAILFGYGVAMQFQKAQRVGINFYRFSARRYSLLFILGMIHAIFIWWGDILAMYAFCAFVLMTIIRFNPWILLAVGLALNGIMHTLYIFLMTASGIANVNVQEEAIDIVSVQNAVTAYGTGNWLDAFVQRLSDVAYQMQPLMWISALFMIMPFMMIGAAAAKWQLVERTKVLKWLWLVFAVLFTGTGLLIKSAPYQMEHTYLYDYLKLYVGGPMLAIGYASIIVVLSLIPSVLKGLSPIAKAGRMSLTLYLMQSIICSIIFYHFGFGLFGKIDVLTGIYISVAIFVLQVIFAEVWFVKFRQGPLEAMMKKWTYRKLSSEK